MIIILATVLVVSIGGSIVYAYASSYNEIGLKIGGIVNDVVLNIHAQHPQLQLTHAHVLAVMCQELPSLSINDINSEGRQEGYTQVIISTYQGLVSGSLLGGACAYTASLEGGACADPHSRTDNARCSIEVGACLYDYLLSQCNGDPACAYNGYNTGSIQRFAQGTPDFVRGYNALSHGQLCAKAAFNRPLWESILHAVDVVTGGTFKTNAAAYVPSSKYNLLRTKIPSASAIQSAPYSYINKQMQHLFGGSDTHAHSSYKQKPRSVSSRRKSHSTTTQTNDNGTNDTSAHTTLQAMQRPKANNEIICLPKPIAPGEEAIVMWACDASSDNAQSADIQTDGHTQGAVRVTPTATATYSVSCKKGDTEISKLTCTVPVDVALHL